MLQQFFWKCAGADEDILSQCSKAEQIKQSGIGGTVFFTAVMAFLAAAYALYTVFDNVYIAIGFGLVWGLLIFNLDRFIVSTIRKRNSFYKEFLQALPRLILAVIIAVVISKPLEMKIFEKEINQVLLTEKNAMTVTNQQQIRQQFNPRIEQLKTEITNLNNEVAAKEKEVNNLYATYIAEAEGREGTLKVGKGPVYKEKREKHDEELKALQALKTQNATDVSSKKAQIDSLQNAYQQKVLHTQPVIDGFDGLMARITALNKLPTLPSLFIFLLFLAIETAPIFAKLLASIGEYDIRLNDAEATVKVWVAQKEYQRNKLLETDHVLNDKVYDDLKTEEELYQHKKQKAKEILELQAQAFYKQQKDIL
ncbi:DUF4407 domain-containing protein [Zhouia sp. PK063]|uniref:DUF4407 domain-containing protein n=1 Tax=Zhouia sp. PK063 TaxID=3373602 RepID=UPI0037A975E3